MTTKAPIQPTTVDVKPVRAAQFPTRSGTDPTQIGEAMTTAFNALVEFVTRFGLTAAGPPRAVYTGYSPDEIEFTVAMPIASTPPSSANEEAIHAGELPGGKALRFVHRGPYQSLSETYGLITEWMTEQGMLESEADWAKYMPMWEEYLNDPGSTPEDELITNIFVPLTDTA